MTEILVPVSVGELVDKVTILRIKSERISDAAKLANILRELSALEKTCTNSNINLQLAEVTELQNINTELWDIEDAIRDKERAAAFDARFIELARAVYKINDRRFAVKSKINQIAGSLYVEEKSYKPY